jgi:multiple sugar transport system permease protein
MRKSNKKIKMIIFESVMVLLAIIWLYPYIWQVLSSFKPQNEIYNNFWPTRLTLDHYKKILVSSNQMDRDFIGALFNSIIISVTSTVSIVLTSAYVGYAVAKFKFWGGSFLKHLTVFQLLFPSFMFTIPLFIVVDKLGLVNTLAGLIVPALFSAWGLFMFTQSFRSVPNDYIEAARIEGASELRIVFTIMLPLSRSTASIVGLFSFIAIWDNFLTPLIIIRDYDKMPLSVLIASFKHGYSTEIGAILAGTVLQTLPMIILFLFFRKYFLQGIAISFK